MGHWAGDRRQTTVWSIAHAKPETGHGTQKPVECMKRPIKNNSSAGHAVYDPFCGSGTTITASEMTGRACLAIDIDPAYVDVAVRRWQAFTGREAVLDGDERSFGQIAVKRGIDIDTMPARKVAASAPGLASLDFDDWGTGL
jgi:DNA modification methylase